MSSWPLALSELFTFVPVISVRRPVSKLFMIRANRSGWKGRVIAKYKCSYPIFFRFWGVVWFLKLGKDEYLIMKELALVVLDRAGDYFSMIQSKFGFIKELTLVITKYFLGGTLLWLLN
jgi:hypothetical protein